MLRDVSRFLDKQDLHIQGAIFINELNLIIINRQTNDFV